MANITLTRIDSRLIHGQVIVKWSRIANGNRIVIVDDELEKDSFMVDIYQMAAPSGRSVEIYSTTRAAEEFKKDKMGEGKILLLFRTLAQATKAYEEGLHFESLQLGGIPQSPGKKKIILDPVFIFGFHMGVQGAALATVLSQAISCVWVIRFLCGKKTQLHIRIKNLRLEAATILPCIFLGLAAFIMQASESVIAVCFNSSLLHYGGDIAVGTMTILTSVMQFAMLPLQGIAQGAQPISSYNYGAKNADRVKKTFHLLLRTCLTYSLLLWVAVQLVPQVFVSIFTSDADLLAFATPALRIYFGGLGLFGIQIACQMTFTSLGKAVNSIVVAIVRKFVLLLPLIYLMPHVVSNPTTGVYMAEPIADVIAVTFTCILFAVQFKKALAEIQ